MLVVVLVLAAVELLVKEGTTTVAQNWDIWIKKNPVTPIFTINQFQFSSITTII